LFRNAAAGFLVLLSPAARAGFFLLLVLLTAGCSNDNPKTRNPLLRNKKLSWSTADASFYELRASGRFLGCGGDYPEECCVAGNWQSLGANGSFRYTETGDGEEKSVDVTVNGDLVLGAGLVLSPVPADGKGETESVRSRITVYEDISESSEKDALSNKAYVTLTRYRGDVFVLELVVEDPSGKIKKIESNGDEITTEVMVTNGKRWTNNPPIILAGKWDGTRPVHTEMTLIYHDGRKEHGTFVTKRVRDSSEVTFEDEWF
jgi:hypothetical protein